MRVKTSYAPFDVADYLDNDSVIAEYLTAAVEDSDPEVFLAALGDVAKAKGMARIARDAGLGRESLYKALASGAHPRFETVSAVLRALGVRLTVVAERRRRPAKAARRKPTVAKAPTAAARQPARRTAKSR
jgi:probable addiction module antidote protein